MRKRNNFRKRKPRENRLNRLQVKVYNNNIEGALKQFKKKVKESNLMLELKKKSYYEKPSKLRREKKNLAILRSRYNNIKEEKSY